MLNKLGTDKAVAHCLDPEEYGGTKEFNLGYCRDFVLKGDCEFASWELCPYRHWKPDGFERAWMKASFLKDKMRYLNKQPHPPDASVAKYKGRRRTYYNGTDFVPRAYIETGTGGTLAW